MEIVQDELTRGFIDTEHLIRVVFRLLMAMLLGTAIGYLREREGKAAGLKTHVIVALGSALFVLAVMEAGATVGEMTRIVQGIATGIGFVGAGSILKPQDPKDRSGVHGLTTAADIWLTAAVGVAVGLGMTSVAVLGMGLTLVTLIVFRKSGLLPPVRGGGANSKAAGEASTD